MDFLFISQFDGHNMGWPFSSISPIDMLGCGSTERQTGQDWKCKRSSSIWVYLDSGAVNICLWPIPGHEWDWMGGQAGKAPKVDPWTALEHIADSLWTVHATPTSATSIEPPPSMAPLLSRDNHSHGNVNGCERVWSVLTIAWTSCAQMVLGGMGKICDLTVNSCS